LLWRLYKAGRLSKPALFLCDRDELREQAYNKLKAVFGDNARIVETKRGENAAKNARIHIATYQTLGLDEEEGEVGSFLSEHYSENAFSVIIIDECHRSAWGRWSEVLKRNHKAIQIGLTATPRQLRESDKRTKEDQEITANNHKYFGDPVYEYTLIQAQEDGYLAACEIVRRKISIDGKTFTSAEVMAANPIDAKTGREITVDEVKKEYTAKDYDDELMMPERIQAMCGDLFEQLCNHGGPEQKVIVFCTREIHAERVVIQLNNLYVRYCKERGKVPKDYYAFKCMGGANNGRDMIEPMRGSGERAFIACTVDLLATGVDIERLNAVVFFRYLESPILFYQMVGRGTRIDEPTKKYKFWLYDYTGVTDLFGTDFIVDPRYPKPKKPKRGEDDGGDTSEGGDGNDGDDKPIVEIAGQTVEVTPQGHYILCSRNGRDVKVPVEEYRDEMIRAVLREASNLNDFRQLWIETQKRRQLINHLIHEQYSPELLLQLEDMLDFDYYDLFASHGYNANALRRIEREGAYLKNNQAWFESMAPNAAIVLKNVGHQFYIGGTEALETEAFWEVPEIRRADGLNALRSIGKPAEIVKDAKRRLFWL
jgi:type I restriction enzyme R subunit